MNNLLIVSCIFGKQFKNVHLSPDNKNSYFFTNNKELKDEIINKGWNYVYVNKVLSDDIIIAKQHQKQLWRLLSSCWHQQQFDGLVSPEQLHDRYQ